MKPSLKHTLNLTACAFVALVLATGCAKKAVQAPPTPVPTPPTTTNPETPTPPTTTPPPPSPGSTGQAPSAADFQPAFFDLDSFTLTGAARSSLDANAKVLRDRTGGTVTIEGHCDERGTEEYNQALGERRAQSAKDYLVAAGIDGSRLRTVSYGKERPFDEGHDESAWAKNRRAHFVTP